MELGARWVGTRVGDESVMSGVDRVDFFKSVISNRNSKSQNRSFVKIEVKDIYGIQYGKITF